MIELTPASSRRNSRSGDSFFKSNMYVTYFRPSVYFGIALLLLVAATIFKSGKEVAIFGALAIIILMMSEIGKFQFGVFLSMVSLVVMVMVNIWDWADSFFIEIFSGNIGLDKAIFPKGLFEGFIVMAAVWYYHKLLKNLKIRVTHEWYVKKSQLKFLVLLLFFQLFLTLFWISGLILQTMLAGHHSPPHTVAVIAGTVSALVAGIPAVIFFFRNSDSRKKHHHHRHHHSRDDED